MAIPNYQELMLPVLQTLNKKGGLKTTECADNVANLLGLNDQEIAELLPSGKQRTIHNRTGWAAWYMMQAGLISRPKRGWIEITEEGRKLLEENPDHIDRRTLMRYPSFVEKITKSSEDADFSQHESEGSGEKTPTKKSKPLSQSCAPAWSLICEIY